MDTESSDGEASIRVSLIFEFANSVRLSFRWPSKINSKFKSDLNQMMLIARHLTARLSIHSAGAGRFSYGPL
jgi:hypothetical protein